MSPARSPEEIRSAIEANRQELGQAVDRLRAEVTEAADWRKKLRQNQDQILMGAAATGFLVGGGIAAFSGLVTRRK